MAENKKKYSQKLLDPRWQRKRLEIMQRDSFACVVCHATDKTLNVHHQFYTPNTEPWDYENNTLFTLCYDCHEMEHELKDFQQIFIRSLQKQGLFNSDFESFIWYINNNKLDRQDLIMLLISINNPFFCREVVRLIKKHNRMYHDHVDIENHFNNYEF